MPALRRLPVDTDPSVKPLSVSSHTQTHAFINICTILTKGAPIFWIKSNTKTASGSICSRMGRSNVAPWWDATCQISQFMKFCHKGLFHSQMFSKWKQLRLTTTLPRCQKLSDMMSQKLHPSKRHKTFRVAQEHWRGLHGLDLHHQVTAFKCNSECWNHWCKSPMIYTNHWCNSGLVDMFEWRIRTNFPELEVWETRTCLTALSSVIFGGGGIMMRGIFQELNSSLLSSQKKELWIIARRLIELISSSNFLFKI